MRASAEHACVQSCCKLPPGCCVLILRPSQPLSGWSQCHSVNKWLFTASIGAAAQQPAGPHSCNGSDNHTDRSCNTRGSANHMARAVIQGSLPHYQLHCCCSAQKIKQPVSQTCARRSARVGIVVCFMQHTQSHEGNRYVVSASLCGWLKNFSPVSQHSLPWHSKLNHQQTHRAMPT